MLKFYFPRDHIICLLLRYDEKNDRYKFMLLHNSVDASHIGVDFYKRTQLRR